MPTLPSRPRTVAELIRGHQHPIVSYQTQSTTTKTVSKAERALHSQLKRVTANSDWVEDIKNRYNFDLEITDDYYESHPRLRSAIDTSLMAETYTERQELDTHTFHRDHILLAAIRIVAAYVDLGGLCNNAPFSAAVREVISSLKTRPGNRTDDSLIYPDHEVCIDAPLEQRWLANPPPSALREAHLLLVEDKTHRVMTKLRTQINDMVAAQSYRWPGVDVDGATPGVRALTQVWSQLAAQRVDGDPAGWINKLYASAPAGAEGLHCFFKLITEEAVEVSRWYNDSDSLVNTVAVLLYSLEQIFTHPQHRTLPSNTVDCYSAPTVSPSASSPYRRKCAAVISFFIRLFWYIMAMIGAVLGGSAGSSQLVPAHLEVDPATQHVQLVRESGQVILFDEIVGKGAVGTAMRSLPERLILKFGFPSPLLHEAAIYTQLAAWRGNLPVPRYLGVFPLDQQRVAILLSDVGSAIDVDDMTPAQRLSLAESIRRLHAAGVHHHDVFGNTVIDHEGNIRLVDLDKAEVVPPGTHCSNCDDEYCLSLLSKQ